MKQSERIAEIYTDVKWIKKKINGHSERITNLEVSRNRINGAISLLSFVVLLISAVVTYVLGVW